MPRRGNRRLKIKHNRAQHQRLRTSRGTRTMSKIWKQWMAPVTLSSSHRSKQSWYDPESYNGLKMSFRGAKR
ncbi:MAG: hypothetical protein DRH43_07590 [Deltaproteobacteria bacterium]|nr:MAG: hypothetical protein DRH43_07590 [Deltaproteobacteria bacterium]